MFPQLDRDLHFGYVRNGSMVLARSADDVKHLHELKARGEKNGVRNLRILDKAELRAIEPHVHEACIAALYSPDAGTVTPYEFAIALAENAVDNGVELRIRREVTAIEALPAVGAGAGAGFQVTARHWEPSAYIQNAPAASGARLSAGSIVGALAAVAAPLLLVVGAHVAPARATALTGAPAATLISVGGTVLALVVVALLGLLARGGGRGGRGFGAASDLKPVGGGGRQCSVEEMKTGGSGSAGAVDGQTVGTETYRARFVVNAAGSASDRVSAMIGDKSFKIKPRIGDYLLLHRDQGYLANTTLFPCPGPLGKGVLVQSTLWGNLILGPTARDMHVAEHAAQTPAQINEQIMRACKALVPAFDPKKVIHAFGGARAKSDRGDWIIEPSAVNGQFIQV